MPNIQAFFAFGKGTTVKQNQAEAQIQKALVTAFQNQQVITLAVPVDIKIGAPPNEDTLFGPHAYTITNIDLANPQKPMFTIQNPWNNPARGAYGASFTVDMDFIFKYFKQFTIRDKNN